MYIYIYLLKIVKCLFIIIYDDTECDVIVMDNNCEV